ncbi:expressed unknown protein [Seminavis robusta]|uniref:Uncharacterized protein n=1 Tax=Seminavis robusta TaxID=568900 RepID=A0A9N8F022_9STRA|nr:expressed unknown protein [Seminavis robusta]|eukprot:Sro2787_g337090.1 n/a (504) ;mRNA; f:9682-11514
MATQTLAPGATLPPGFTIPPGATLPPDFTIPPGLSIPPGLTLAPGTTIPPGLLNGNATTGGVTDGPNTNTATGADNNGFGDINLGSFNATPFFLPAPIRTYERAGATTGMAGIPRFGHNSDFANVAYLASSTNKADGEDYIVGLMFAGCFLLVFFLVWTIVLIIFKVAMSGFLSGEPFMNPHIHDPVSKQAKEDAKIHGREYKEDNSWLKRPRRIRITFFFCGLIQIIFAILLVNQGMANLQQTTDTIQVSSESIRLLVKEADGVALNLKQVGDTGLILRDQVVFDLNKDNFCPGNPLFVQTSIGQSLIGASDGAAQMLNQLGDFVTNNVATLEESLAATEQQLDSLDRSMAEAESYEWLAGLIAFPYMLLASLMILGAFAAQLDAMTECFLCMLNWVILPLYIFVTIFSYIVLAVAAIAASLNADFCGGETSSPDQVLVDLLFRSGFQEDGLLFQTVRYYAYQCTARAEVDPFMFLRSFDGVIVSFTCVFVINFLGVCFKLD